MKAYELIDLHGWLQGRYGSCEIGFCIMGAIYEAYGFEEAYKYRTLIRECVGSSASAWNDKPGRTKSEVITLLKELEGVAT